MLDANAATMIRPVALVKISSNASTTSSSEPVNPRRSMFVLSARRASTPSDPSSRESVDVEMFAVDGRLVDLEIAGVDDDADRRVNRQRDAVGDAVRHADELDLERPDPHAIAWLDRNERMRAGEPVLLQLRLDERQRQRRAVHRAVHVRHDVGHRADVIFVTVCQHQSGDRASLLQVRHVRDDPIDAQQFRVGKHHARVDDDRRLVPAEREHVHAELAESAKRHYFKHSTQEIQTSPALFLAERVRRRSRESRLNQAAGRA